MRRWLIAIFALHFLVNVGLFAFGQIETAAPAQPNQMVAPLLDSAEPVHENDLLEHASDHGLTDTQPELPEWLHLDVVLLASTCDMAAPVATLLHPVAPPTLDGPQRPPRIATYA